MPKGSHAELGIRGVVVLEFVIGAVGGLGGWGEESVTWREEDIMYVRDTSMQRQGGGDDGHSRCKKCR